MKVVKDLLVTQTAGITICSTIHSPTPYCFRLFDRMMILLRGQVVYFGQRGACHGSRTLRSNLWLCQAPDLTALLQLQSRTNSLTNCQQPFIRASP